MIGIDIRFTAEPKPAFWYLNLDIDIVQQSSPLVLDTATNSDTSDRQKPDTPDESRLLWTGLRSCELGWEVVNQVEKLGTRLTSRELGWEVVPKCKTDNMPKMSKCKKSCRNLNTKKSQLRLRTRMWSALPFVLLPNWNLHFGIWILTLT